MMMSPFGKYLGRVIGVDTVKRIAQLPQGRSQLLHQPLEKQPRPLGEEVGPLPGIPRSLLRGGRQDQAEGQDQGKASHGPNITRHDRAVEPHVLPEISSQARLSAISRFSASLTASLGTPRAIIRSG